MINKKQNDRMVLLTAVLVGLVTVFSCSFSLAQSGTPAASGDNILFLQGIVRQVSSKNNSFSVKISKGKKLKILFSPQVELKGIASLTELKKGARVKVWYKSTGEENRAVKVELLPELGC